MRVTLVHNPAAGDGDHSGRHLSALLRAAGHELSYHASTASGLEDLLAKPADLLLVAGGDGTVGQLIRKVAGQDVLLSILPLGTANNIAAALGIDVGATPEEHIADLATASTRKLDVAVARAAWGTELFVESAGVGCFAALLDDSGARGDAPGEDGRARATLRLRRLVERAPVRHRRIVADGLDLSGSYLLVAALNTPRIGPRAELAPAADPGDGWLDLLLIRDEARRDLMEYLAASAAGRPATMPAATRRVRRVRLGWDEREGHLDDGRWPDESAGRSGDAPGREPDIVELEIAAAGVRVAVPGAGSRAASR